MMQKAEITYFELAEDDYTYIDEMAAFYDISADEAYERFLAGNPDGIMEEPESDESE